MSAIETTPAPPPAITGAWVKQVREGFGLTQAELGALLGGIHGETMSRIEAGRRHLGGSRRFKGAALGPELIFRALAHQHEKGIGDPAHLRTLLRGLPWPSAVAMLISRTPACYLGDMNVPALGTLPDVRQTPRPVYAVDGPAPSHGAHPPVFEAPPAFERAPDRSVDRTQEWE